MCNNVLRLAESCGMMIVWERKLANVSLQAYLSLYSEGYRMTLAQTTVHNPNARDFASRTDNNRTKAARVYRFATDQTPIPTNVRWTLGAGLAERQMNVDDLYRIVRSRFGKCNRSGTVRLPVRGQKGRHTVRAMNREYRSVDVLDMIQDVVGDCLARLATDQRPNVGVAIRQEDVRRNKGRGYWSVRYTVPASDGLGWVRITRDEANDLIESRKGRVLSGEHIPDRVIEATIREGFIPIMEHRLIVRNLSDAAQDTNASDFYVQELFGKLRTLLEGLSERDQNIIRMYVMGHSPEQIANECKIERTTVWRVVSRVKNRMAA
jgi:hypothetical protein